MILLEDELLWPLPFGQVSFKKSLAKQENMIYQNYSFRTTDRGFSQALLNWYS